MERTISITKGDGSINHNTRKFYAKNVDPERTRFNIQFCNQDIKEAYHILFDEAVERYNAKQTRSDRMIDNYYDKIRVGKQEKLFRELVVQIGNKDDMNAKTEDGELAKELLTEYMQGFQERNPNLYVFSAHLHMDEETPHLHIDYIPFITGSKRGLDTRVSQKKALAAQGFLGGTASDSEASQWVQAEKEALAEIMARRDVQWLQKGTHEKHLSVLDFKKQERAKEVATLDVEYAKSSERLQETNQLISERTEVAIKLEIENEKLSDENDRLQGENDELEQSQLELQKEIEEMAGSKKKLERNVRAYDEDPKWQLPDPGLIQSAKAYRDKVALPILNKLKSIVKSLTIQCVQLIADKDSLQKKVEKQGEDILYYKAKLGEQRSKISEFEEESADLKLLKGYLGEEKANAILDTIKETELEQKKQKQAKRTAHRDVGR